MRRHADLHGVEGRQTRQVRQGVRQVGLGVLDGGGNGGLGIGYGSGHQSLLSDAGGRRLALASRADKAHYVTVVRRNSTALSAALRLPRRVRLSDRQGGRIPQLGERWHSSG